VSPPAIITLESGAIGRMDTKLSTQPAGQFGDNAQKRLQRARNQLDAIRGPKDSLNVLLIRRRTEYQFPFHPPAAVDSSTMSIRHRLHS